MRIQAIRVKSLILLIFWLMVVLLLPAKLRLRKPFIFVTERNICLAESPETPLKQPETIEDFERIGKKSTNLFPEAIKNAWNEALKIWKDIYEKVKTWTAGLRQTIKRFFERLWQALKGEAERRKPMIEEDFEKERKEFGGEMKEEMPAIRKNLWQRFLEMIK